MSHHHSAESLSEGLRPQCRAGNGTARLQITLEARRYALKELVRRAGVSPDFFQKWQMEVTPDRTIVSLASEVKGKIHFLHSPAHLFEEVSRGHIPVARAGWLRAPGDTTLSPDLVLPFCESDSDIREPLYRATADGNIVCRLDLLSSFLLTLSRFEETLSRFVDEHGRFPASASLALHHEFMDRPILDEHGLAFEQVLSLLLPVWQLQPRILRFKLTHDIDDIGIPFQLRSSIGHSLKRHRPSATLRDFLALLTSADPAELALVEELAAISHSRGLHSAFYWKAGSAGPRDSGYDTAHSKVQYAIHCLRERGFEMGVHPGYDTFRNRTKLAQEVSHLRETLQVNSPGGRQHYLRWSPDTWLDWEACGLSYDSSLGFADRFGFRAGTAFPYRPWCFKDNRELHLIEVPLILMDCSAVKYMKLARREGLDRIRRLIERTARTGGVFTLLWHNTPLLDPDYNGWYEPILDMLNGGKRFNIPANAGLLW